MRQSEVLQMLQRMFWLKPRGSSEENRQSGFKTCFVATETEVCMCVFFVVKKNAHTLTLVCS